MSLPFSQWCRRRRYWINLAGWQREKTTSTWFVWEIFNTDKCFNKTSIWQVSGKKNYFLAMFTNRYMISFLSQWWWRRWRYCILLSARQSAEKTHPGLARPSIQRRPQLLFHWGCSLVRDAKDRTTASAVQGGKGKGAHPAGSGERLSKQKTLLTSHSHPSRQNSGKRVFLSSYVCKL